MKLRFLSTEALNVLKNTVSLHTENYNTPDNLWIRKEVLSTKIFIDFKTDVNKFELNPEKDDLENIKILYENLKILTDTQAADERLWAGLCHDIFWKYMQQRWNLNKAVDKTQYILKNYFFAHGQKRSLITNALAKLWWIGRLTYNSNFENPFMLTEYLSKDINGRGFPLFGSNFSNNRTVLHTFLLTLKEFEENNNSLSRELFLEMIKFMNMLSGKYLLEYLGSTQLLKSKLVSRLEYLTSK